MARIYEHAPPKPQHGFKVSEYTPEVRTLGDVVTTLRTVVAAVIASGGGKPGKVQPYPGAITVVEEVKYRAAKERHEALVRRVLPGDTVDPA